MSPRGTTLYDEDILSWCSQWYTCCMLMLRAREIPTWVRGRDVGIPRSSSSLAAAGRGWRPLFYSSAVLSIPQVSTISLADLTSRSFFHT